MKGLVFRQLFDRESCTYTYLLGDSATKEALLIDPVDTKVDRDLQFVDDLGLKLRYCLNTHVHADHITGGGIIKERRPGVKSVLGVGGKPAIADLFLEDGEELKFGQLSLTAVATPGHTNGCTTFVLADKSMAFTGDTLFVRGCGRTDFQQGSSESLYDSVHKKIYTLPDTCRVFPGHDYNGRT
jgi:sulfur dioxygenase